MCPVMLNQSNLNTQHFPVYWAQGAFALIKRLPITEALANTGGTGKDWLKSHVLEYLVRKQSQRSCSHHNCSATGIW